MTPVDVIWVTANGARVWISEMDTSHLDNAKRMIERKGWTGRFPQYQRICRELEARELALRIGLVVRA